MEEGVVNEFIFHSSAERHSNKKTASTLRDFFFFLLKKNNHILHSYRVA